MQSILYQKAQQMLETLCVQIQDRSVGSVGNRMAAKMIQQELKENGWKVETAEFEAFDWKDGGAELKAGDTAFEVYTSPYSLGAHLEGELTAAGSIEDLENGDFQDKILMLYDNIAKEQLMPKNFVFYNPEHHQKIISLLEKSGAIALICVTERNGAASGGVYPFPLIEDGDFDIPSVYMTEEEGERLYRYLGEKVVFYSGSERIPGTGCNVSAVKGNNKDQKIVVTAHFDAKKNVPGALDNASGVAVLLLLSFLLKNEDLNRRVELVFFNGEDYYAASGQMKYLSENQDLFEKILMNINIDGAGYGEGFTAFSFYDLPNQIEELIRKTLKTAKMVVEGDQWFQGDHSIFIQQNRPAVAVTSAWLIDHLEDQTVTHTDKDAPALIDINKLVEIAEILKKILLEINQVV